MPHLSLREWFDRRRRRDYRQLIEPLSSHVVLVKNRDQPSISGNGREQACLAAGMLGAANNSYRARSAMPASHKLRQSFDLIVGEHRLQVGHVENLAVGL